MTPPRDLRGALGSRDAARAQIREARIDRTEVEVRIPIRGSGETRVSVAFPVTFTEKPISTGGGELLTPAAAGAFPVISVMVDGNAWKTRDRSDQRIYYVGCDLLIVALGADDQRVIAHCLFAGNAFRGPNAGAGFG